MSSDELDLEKIGTERTAMFVIVSDTDSTFDFVVAMLYSQLFNFLCDIADEKYGGRLPYHVRMILDEFANQGKIPGMEKLITTIRSREISANIILQSKSQLKTMYKDAADTIWGNCDSLLYLGGKEPTTLKELSEILGKETVDVISQTDTRGTERTSAMSYQKIGKDLMTRDEIAVMDGSRCILQITGVRPFFSKKYDIRKHPRYHELSDEHPEKVFDIEAYVRCQSKVKADDVAEYYEVSV